jgi:molybdenum cofactor sulfurtransferase
LSNPTTAPDFVALSFYKIFGFPNLGALLVRKESANVLQSRRYFGGGTVDMVIAINDTWHAKKDLSTHDRLEDGTLPFHSILALNHVSSVTDDGVG